MGRPEVAAGVAGDRLQRLAEGAVGELSVRDSAGEELPGQVVAALRQADFEVTLGASVELGGPPGARAAATFRPSVLRLEEAVLHEAVEVELGDMVGDADASCGLVPAHRRTLRDHEAVQGAPHWSPEAGEPVEPSVEINGHISSRPRRRARFHGESSFYRTHRLTNLVTESIVNGSVR